jgi:hypothetical protein
MHGSEDMVIWGVAPIVRLLFGGLIFGSGQPANLASIFIVRLFRLPGIRRLGPFGRWG